MKEHACAESLHRRHFLVLSALVFFLSVSTPFFMIEGQRKEKMTLYVATVIAHDRVGC